MIRMNVAIEPTSFPLRSPLWLKVLYYLCYVAMAVTVVLMFTSSHFLAPWAAVLVLIALFVVARLIRRTLRKEVRFTQYAVGVYRFGQPLYQVGLTTLTSVESVPGGREIVVRDTAGHQMTLGRPHGGALVWAPYVLQGVDRSEQAVIDDSVRAQLRAVLV